MYLKRVKNITAQLCGSLTHAVTFASFCLSLLAPNPQLAFAQTAPQLTENDFAALESKLTAKKYVVGVGVQNFKHNSLWPNLKFAAKDAKDFHDKLISTKGSVFESGALLQGLSQTKKVTQDDVFETLERLDASKLKEQDTLIVYVSSHGTVKYRPDGSIGRYIVMSETDPKNVAETAVDYQKLVKKFRSLKPKKKALILAFCYSGNQNSKGQLTAAMKREASLLKNGEFFAEPVEVDLSEGELILSASGWKEPASEDPSLQNDIYTHYLLRGLNYDRNSDGATTLLEAHDYATEQTIRHTSGRQRPNIDLKVVGEDPFIIKGKRHRKGNPILYALEGFFRDVLVYANGKNMGSLKKGIVMPTGTVDVELRHKRTKEPLAKLQRVFEPGEVYSASEFAKAPKPHQFTAGLTQLFYANDSLNEKLASKSNLGWHLQYLKDDFAWGLTALGAVTLYLPRSETVTGQVAATGTEAEAGGSGSGADSSTEAKLTQERTTVELELGLTTNTLVSWLSSRRFGLNSSLHIGPSVGVTGFYLVDQSFGKDRFLETDGKENLWFPMVKGNAMVVTSVIDTGLHASVGLRAGAMLTAERFDGADAVALSVSARAGLGWRF